MSVPPDLARRFEQLPADARPRDGRLWLSTDHATIERAIDQREGKVYVDFLQNGQGKLLVAPFSLRPIAGAPASTPLSWDEVVPGLDSRAHTIATVPGRLRERGDPLRDVLALKPDLLAALEKLAALM